jgi:hypothetical protein
MDPTEKLRPGMTGSQQTVVTREITVAHFHPEMPEVYGTPFLVYLIEVAASNAIREHLPKGWASVGCEVHVKHLAATPVWTRSTADSSSFRSKRTTEWLRSAPELTSVLSSNFHDSTRNSTRRKPFPATRPTFLTGRVLYAAEPAITLDRLQFNRLNWEPIEPQL